MADSAADDSQSKPPLDPRAEKVRDEFIRQLSSAETIWRDALRSQIRLASSLDELTTIITDIKQFTQLPSYPAGVRRLQACQARIGGMKKRIGAIGPRLSRLSVVVQQSVKQRPQAEVPNEEIVGAAETIADAEADAPK